MKRIFLFAVLTVMLLAGCSTLDVSLKKANKAKMADVQKIAFVKITFSERELPLFPLVDAGIYNMAVASEAQKFAEINTAYAEEMTKFYSEELLSLTDKDIVLVRGKEPYTGFESDDALLTMATIQKIASENTADLIVTVSAKVISTEVSAFGIRGASYLKNTMSLYSPKGELLGQAYFTTESDWSDPKNMKAYQALLDYYKVLGPEMTELLF
jgi:hypothetical protein